MSYDIKIQGKVYSFDTLSEYKSVKDMSSSERAAYVANMSNEDEMQTLGDDFDEGTSALSLQESNNTSQEQQEAELQNDAALNIMLMNGEISSLQQEKRALYNSLMWAGSSEERMEIFRQTGEIQNEINSIRSEMIAALSIPASSIGGLSNDFVPQSLDDSAFALQGTDSGDSIVNFAESYLGRKNPSRSAEGNEFVRVERGGTCDDFATYVVDNSLQKEQRADWYNNLSEREKAWGPDVFRAAKEAGSTVSLKNAKSGDLAAIDLNGNGGMDHTVIIKEVKNGKVYTVESNGGSIINKTYDADKVCSVARVIK